MLSSRKQIIWSWPTEMNSGSLKTQRRFILTILTSLLVQATAEMRHDSGNRFGGIDDILEVLRDHHSSSSADGPNWSEAVDRWITEIGEENLQRIPGVENAQYDHLSARELIWKLWNSLGPSTREHVIKKLYPFLIPDFSSSLESRWTLHCADAYKLCMEDNNCYWKYINFISHCSEQDLDALKGFDTSVKSSQYNRPKSSRRRKQVRGSTKRSVKRDVQLVQKRMRNQARNEKRRRHKHRQKSLFWMGKYVSKSKFSKSVDLLRYFSLNTRTYKCSPKCVNSLIMLNETIYGTLLAHCDCRAKTMPAEHRSKYSNSSRMTQKSVNNEKENLKDFEETCLRHQQTAQVCRPRFFTGKEGAIGCTEARQKCEKDPTCKNAQDQFLSRCSQVINGLHCSPACKESVQLLRNSTKHYDSCICDGTEGPICTQIRSNVLQLCETRSDQTLPQTEYIVSKKHNKYEKAGYKPSYISEDNNFDSYPIPEHDSRTILNHKSWENSAKSSNIFRENFMLLIAFAVNYMIRN